MALSSSSLTGFITAAPKQLNSSEVAALAGNPEPSKTDDDRPSLYTALQQQLRLKREGR
jgi:hypothetical protein